MSSDDGLLQVHLDMGMRSKEAVRWRLIVMNLLRVASLFLRELDGIFILHRLTVASANVVSILECAEEPLSPDQIAERLLAATSTMTSPIDTAERRGLVRRISHRTDRRKNLVEVSDQSRARVKDATSLAHVLE